MKVLDGKVLGVIGGMGPLATNIFYKMIIDKTEATEDQEHINMIILNHATMPDRSQAIKSGDYKDILEKMIKDVKFLEDAGVECIVIPCNTAHFMLESIQSSTRVKVIDMIAEGTEKVKNSLSGSNKKVGILATTGTIEMGLYQKSCMDSGIEPILPSEDDQKKVMKIIYEGIKNGKGVDSSDFDKIVDGLRDKGCEKILLACTELSAYKVAEGLDNYFIDAMEALAEKAIDICKGEKG